MLRSLSQIVVATAAVALVLGVVSSPTVSIAQEEAASIVVGIYNPQQVAQATGLQDEVMQQMQGLQQRAQQAQQAGDQEAMQQIQMEAQQLQQNAAAEFAANLETVMPGVAAQVGAQVIATEVAYAAPGVTTQDVTEAVVAALTAGEDDE